MIPIPQYPLYSAAMSLYGGTPCPYYLDEESGWQLDIKELERAIESTKAQGKNVKAIVVINPGNPTGAIFSFQTIKKIIEFSVKNKLLLIADEVILFQYRFIERTSTKLILILIHSERSSKQWIQSSKILVNLLLCIQFQKDFWGSAV